MRKRRRPQLQERHLIGGSIGRCRWQAASSRLARLL